MASVKHELNQCSSSSVKFGSRCSQFIRTPESQCIRSVSTEYITGAAVMMSMCRVFSCVIGRGYFLWPVCSLGRTLLAFALLHSALQGQICLLLRVFLDFLLLHSSPLQWIGHPFWMLVVECLVGLHRTVNFASTSPYVESYWHFYKII